jgi:glucose dehydrogenase
MTYRGPDGKQYVVISAGSHQPAGDQPLGDFLVAFTL